ncbi:MAG TPA: hypothetical protein VK714_07540 [Myxococcota bacterium]|nr:hypothetical protein [Myxococcota bacterium]
MAEVRRYQASDIRGAERKLAVDAAELAKQGLRPTWMVWFDGARARQPRRAEGELVVQFDALGSHTGVPPRLLRVFLVSLVVKMRELVRAYEETLVQLDSLAQDSASSEARGSSRSTAKRAAFERRRRRIERMVREIEQEIETLQHLERMGQIRL